MSSPPSPHPATPRVYTNGQTTTASNILCPPPPPPPRRSLSCLGSVVLALLSLATQLSVCLSFLSLTSFSHFFLSLTLRMKKLTAIQPFDRSGPAGLRLRQNSSSAPSTCASKRKASRRRVCPPFRFVSCRGGARARSAHSVSKTNTSSSV